MSTHIIYILVGHDVHVYCRYITNIRNEDMHKTRRLIFSQLLIKYIIAVLCNVNFSLLCRLVLFHCMLLTFLLIQLPPPGTPFEGVKVVGCAP